MGKRISEITQKISEKRRFDLQENKNIANLLSFNHEMLEKHVFFAYNKVSY